MQRRRTRSSNKQPPSGDTQARNRENTCSVIDNKDLREVWHIGSGFYADVYFGVWSSFENKNQQVAVKCLKEAAIKRLNILEEASNMSKIKNDHIIKFHGICGVDKDVKLVMEYARFGSLMKVMRDPEQRKFFCQHMRLKDFAMQICHGMQYLAGKGLVHCNLGSRNVLVVGTDLVRINCDFAIGRALGQTLLWYAPEVLEHQDGYTHKSDVYSFGVVLWEIRPLGKT